MPKDVFTLLLRALKGMRGETINATRRLKRSMLVTGIMENYYQRSIAETAMYRFKLIISEGHG